MHERDSTRGIQGWKDNLTACFASVLFLGYAPVASGTVGSLPAIAVALWLKHKPGHLLALAAVIFLLGIVASRRSQKLFKHDDPPEVVIDEFVGMLLAFLWLPMTANCIVAVFILFRLFDIVKPFPARQCERIGGGLGIMADDVVAGIYANLAFRLLTLIF